MFAHRPNPEAAIGYELELTSPLSPSPLVIKDFSKVSIEIYRGAEASGNFEPAGKFIVRQWHEIYSDLPERKAATKIALVRLRQRGPAPVERKIIYETDLVP